ncbi:MOSC N-terminal beta barrel domain-containing protein [Streptomyces sp. AV19]|uniref:MOSC domain-containing protein n=1 Tax=Streptomyces sp. AV19 TaxID=2793068 RepID=UPI0018FE94A0|nr:MOSC N-terminal beta barrel domain-containing protein [Streptomyces sp. AV19]MBH1937936.1 MOSC N-terminal beta barrel domain-containing protein [Streptomyces sp. AV19]MDG4536574.1 MOSC N-terminal beta barrel domain-containing protein [Streptomyces sp. AV19]
MARVVELLYYPIKGCAGTSVAAAELTPAGLAHDRTFMVTDEQGVFRSQRRDPRLALIRPAVGADGTVITLRAPGADALDVAVDTTGPRRAVELFKNPYRGIDQGDAAAAWLTEVLGAPSRLVRVPPEHDRVTDGLTPGTSGWADSSALHLLSRSSLDLLARKLAEGGAEPLPMSRFRPNAVVDGWDEPHTEDRLRRVTVGDAALGYTKLAVRCAVTTVDQEAGAKAGPEPLRTLAAYRRAGGGGVVFGAKFSVVRCGKLSVGDEVVVEEWGPSER